MLKKIVIGLIAGFGISTAQAQIPVTDAVMNSQTIANQAANIAKFVEQITQLKAQLEQSKQMYNSLSGLRDVNNLLRNDLLAQYLPRDYKAAYDALKSGRNGDMAGVSGSLNQIAASAQARACESQPRGQSAACKSAWQTMAMNQYVGEEGYRQSARNIQNLEQFVNKIGSSPDAKTVQDLQARIAVEQVKLQNEQIKLQTIQMMQKAEEDMRLQNQHDNTQQMLRTSTPIRF